MRKRKDSNVSSERRNWEKIFNGLVQMLRTQQNQIQSLVNEWKFLQHRTTMQHDGWASDFRLYKDQISEMKGILILEEKIRLLEGAKAELLLGSKHREASILKWILAMQSQLLCSGCRSMLLYPRGATNVCCALCNTITSVPAPGMEMSQLYCGGCRTLLMYTCGATSVRCSCCHTVNLVPASSHFAHIHCGNCRTTLLYPYGAPSVKCAVCHYITDVTMTNGRFPNPVHRPNGTTNSGIVPSTSTSMPHSQSQTVVVENPMSIDASGKLVSNVVVGITTEKK